MVELVDVALEGEVDQPVLVEHLRATCHLPHARRTDAADQLVLDLRVPEVEEVAGVVPDEPVTVDRAAVAADLVRCVDQDVVRLAEGLREGEAAHAGADDQRLGPHVRGTSPG